MAPWIIPAIISLLLYGLWGFLPKVAQLQMSDRAVMLYTLCGSITTGLLLVLRLPQSLTSSPLGIGAALLTGVTGVLGTWFFLQALSRGGATTVIMVTALYPLVSVLLTVLLLHEPLTLRQGAGMLLGLASLALLAG